MKDPLFQKYKVLVSDLISAVHTIEAVDVRGAAIEQKNLLVRDTITNCTESYITFCNWNLNNMVLTMSRGLCEHSVFIMSLKDQPFEQFIKEVLFTTFQMK